MLVLPTKTYFCVLSACIINGKQAKGSETLPVNGEDACNFLSSMLFFLCRTRVVNCFCLPMRHRISFGVTIRAEHSCLGRKVGFKRHHRVVPLNFRQRPASNEPSMAMSPSQVPERIPSILSQCSITAMSYYG